jgi:hypothetical protein
MPSLESDDKVSLGLIENTPHLRQRQHDSKKEQISLSFVVLTKQCSSHGAG